MFQYNKETLYFRDNQQSVLNQTPFGNINENCSIYIFTKHILFIEHCLCCCHKLLLLPCVTDMYLLNNIDCLFNNIWCCIGRRFFVFFTITGITTPEILTIILLYQSLNNCRLSAISKFFVVKCLFDMINILIRRIFCRFDKTVEVFMELH